MAYLDDLRAAANARIVPAPAYPAPGFTARRDALAAALAAEAALPGNPYPPVTLTGRTFYTARGAVWWEVADAANTTSWLSPDEDPDRGADLSGVPGAPTAWADEPCEIAED